MYLALESNVDLDQLAGKPADQKLHCLFLSFASFATTSNSLITVKMD